MKNLKIGSCFSMIALKLESRKAIEGPARAPHRAMYKAMGLTDADLDRHLAIFILEDLPRVPSEA
jgi:dihydroxyacid dehydratase/phosphogluconate dehydratase